jgi:hypothetical protein
MSFTSQDFGHPHGDWKIKVMGFYPKNSFFNHFQAQNTKKPTHQPNKTQKEPKP